MNVLGAILAYLVGGIPLGLILCKLWKGVDPRDVGSGNIGATNVSRILGPVGGVIVFLMDVAKGFLAVRLATLLGGAGMGPWYPIAAAVAALIGNNWPVWLKFKGGKGSSVSLGIGLAVTPVVALCAFSLFVLVLLLSGYASIASILAVASGPVWTCILISPTEKTPQIVFTLGVAALVIYKHRANIKRLRDGTEPKTDLFKRK